MTASTIAFSNASDSYEAGVDLGNQISQGFSGECPHALIVFASPAFEYEELLRALHETCHPEVLVGCSSAGEFVNRQRGESSVSAIALRSTEMKFAAGLGKNLGSDVDGASRSIISSFTGMKKEPALFHVAMILTDPLSGHADDLIESLNTLTGGVYRFFGGGAGDDARFQKTHVFCGHEVVSDAAVALEILSEKPIGVGVQHGWKPAGKALRVTESDGMRLISLNAAPAVEIFEEYAEETGQHFDPENPIPFFLHNVIGIASGDDYKLRVPLAVNSDGSITCAAEVPEGVTVYIMSATEHSATDAAESATREAVDQLNGARPEAALFFDCVATRLRMGNEFGVELGALERSLGDAKYAGCNTYGQIARVPGQFSGFHNCTAVVCVLPS